jgi:hypothetical protein
VLFFCCIVVNRIKYNYLKCVVIEIMKTPFSFAFPKNGLTNASILNMQLAKALRFIIDKKAFTIWVLFFLINKNAESRSKDDC